MQRDDRVRRGESRAKCDEEDELKPYEALFILAETIRDENVEDFAAKTRAEIERLGGVIEQTLPMGRRPFALPLHKREGGVYLRIDFQMDPVKVNTLQARFKLNENIFRMQFVCVDTERKQAAMAKPAVEAPVPAQEG
jgi:ribosomal protein S6